MQIRQAVLSDYPGFARVAREVHEHHVAAVPSVFRSDGVVVSEAYFADLITAENCDILLADCDGEIVGYAVLLLRQTDRDILVSRSVGFIENFGITVAQRRSGIGRLLFAACAARAKERGATSLELDCWEANQEALRFYASMGMRATRRRLAVDL